MAQYVDGYVLCVPKKNLTKYKSMATRAGKIWIKHGALSVFECVGEDMNPVVGGVKLQTFPKFANKKPNEVVLFSFMIYKSRAHRDRVNAKVMSDPAIGGEDMCNEKNPPFDWKKMVYGGFETIVSLNNK